MLSSREGTVALGEGCGLSIFGSAALFLCRGNGDDGCNDLEGGERVTRILSVLVVP